MEYNKDYLDKLHKEILTIMDEIVRICNKHNIKYYMIGGTLLGAVRHKGFIPWDDDLDICMPRQDYMRFIKIAENKLKNDFELKWISTYNKYCLEFAKVTRKNTLFEDFPGRMFGIFVDIFPLDETKGYRECLNRRKGWIYRFSTMCRQKTHEDIENPIKRFISKKIPNFLMYKMIYFVSTLDGKNLEYYTNFGSQYSTERQTIKKAYYGEGVELPFEDRMYRAPSNYHEVLKSIFGEGYMQIPPKEKQKMHYPLKVVFSDGTVMTFKKPSKTLTVEDQ